MNFPQLDTTTLDDLELLQFDAPEAIAGFAMDWALQSAAIETDLTVIKRYPRPTTVKYEFAVSLASKMPRLQDGEALFAIVSGNFVFGDWIEAYLVENDLFAEELHIATLSLGQNNVDSLANLRHGGFVDDMRLIVSDFWYAHERRKQGGVPYIMDKLGSDRFRFAAAGLHTKVTLIKTTCGLHLVCHGSANLRSSRNLEQVCIENNRELYRFNQLWMNRIMDNFQINKKNQRGNELWQTVQEPQQQKPGQTEQVGEK